LRHALSHALREFLTFLYPRLLTFGHLVIPTYGALLACAVIAALLLAVALARRLRIDADRVWTLSLLAVASAIVGSKLLLILNNWSSFREDPRLLLSLPTLQSGGVFLGGIVLAFAVCVPYSLYAKLPLLRTMDVIAPALALGQGIGRIGCLAAGCCYGRPTQAGWGLVFTSRFAARTTGVPLGVPLYPTQVFESMASLVICAVLLWLLAHRHRDGEVMGAWLFLYGVARFFIEFYRGDPGRGDLFHGALSVTQLIAAVMVVLGGVLWSRADARDDAQRSAAA
jgi:phosphatidylglycerol:prolipoprotein diacylglycerol transferase